VQFSWVSAAEGKKWVDVVDKVIEDVRALGPFVRYHTINSEYAIPVIDAMTGSVQKEVSIHG
jgi:F420-non-reducing hydrogenase iron-sulfur subunit